MNHSSFPRYGFKLSFFEEFLKSHASLLNGKTTADCKEIVKRETEQEKTSLAEYLKKRNHSDVGVANVFASHAWRYIFEDVVEALRDHLTDQNYDLETTFIWFDVFSFNQHDTTGFDDDFWCNTFRDAIAAMECTLMILAPWENPIPLTRAWCIWELYCTIDANRRFEIAMSRSQKSKLHHDLSHNDSEPIQRMESLIRSRHSAAESLATQEKIHNAIERTVGFDALDRLIFHRLKQWMLDVIEKLDKSRQNVGSEFSVLKNRSSRVLGSIYMNQGDYKRSKAIFARLAADGRKEGDDLNDDSLFELFCKDDGSDSPCGIIFKWKRALIPEQPPETWAEIKNIPTDQLKLEDLNVFDLGCLDSMIQLSITQMAQKLVSRGLDPNYIESLNGLGKIHFREGNYDLAERMWKKCLEESIFLLGRACILSLNYVSNLCAAYLENGKFEDAERFNNIQIEIMKKVYGDDTTLILPSMIARAMILTKKGNYQESEELLINQIANLSNLQGNGDSMVLLLKINLAAALEGQRKFAQAEEELRYCFERRRTINGDDHYDTIKTFFDLLMNLLRQKKINRIEEIVQRFWNFNDARDPLGNDSEFLLAGDSRIRLFREKRTNLMEALFTSLLESSESEYGKDNLESLRIRYILLTIQKNGFLYDIELNSVKKLCQELSDRSKETLGINHPLTLNAQFNLAIIFHQERKYYEAAKLLHQSYQDRLLYLGRAHPDTLTTMHAIATLTDREGRYELAKRMYHECLEMRRSVLGADHIDTLTTLMSLAFLHLKLGEHETAERIYFSVFETARKRLGYHYYFTWRALTNLVVFFDYKGDKESSERITEQYLREFRNALGDEHPFVLDLVLRLGGFYYQLGKFDLAEQTFIYSLRTLKRMYDVKDPILQFPITALTRVWVESGKYDMLSIFRLIYQLLNTRVAL